MNQSPGTRAYIKTTQYIFQKVNWPRDKLIGGEGRIKKKEKEKQRHWLSPCCLALQT
jgi:hypothetical protein